MEFPPDYPPLLVQVKSFDWEAIPATDPPTPRDMMLLEEIKINGGVDLTVPPGIYAFNIIPEGGVDQVYLLPAKFSRGKLVLK